MVEAFNPNIQELEASLLYIVNSMQPMFYSETPFRKVLALRHTHILVQYEFVFFNCLFVVFVLSKRRKKKVLLLE